MEKINLFATCRESADKTEVFINILDNNDQIVLHISFHDGKSKNNIGSIHFKWFDFDKPNCIFCFTINRIWYDSETSKLFTYLNINPLRNKIEQILLTCLNTFTFVLDLGKEYKEHEEWRQSERGYYLKYLKYKNKYLKLKKSIQLD